MDGHCCVAGGKISDLSKHTPQAFHTFSADVAKHLPEIFITEKNIYVYGISFLLALECKSIIKVTAVQIY